jgi:hypothetical protein
MPGVFQNAASSTAIPDTLLFGWFEIDRSRAMEATIHTTLSVASSPEDK